MTAISEVLTDVRAQRGVAENLDVGIDVEEPLHPHRLADRAW